MMKAELKSHPTWVCGLKLMINFRIINICCHTLRGCVDWNRLYRYHRLWWGVTPYVGVWIETLILNNLPVRISCHTLRGCVDWNQLKKPLEVPPDVTPYVGVWIETRQSDNKHFIWQSHPTWVCGLKLPVTWYGRHAVVSHPTWVCGLKLPKAIAARSESLVTPYVGVWIETSMAQYSAISKMVTPCVGIYGLEHCSLVGQVYGRTVSIRPLMYFSPGFWFCYDWKKHVQARMLIFCLSSFVVSPRWQCIGT